MADVSKQDGNIIFDISGLADYLKNADSYSGIQRVVAMLISEFAELKDPNRLYLSYVSNITGKHMVVPFKAAGRDNLLSPAKMRGLLHTSKGNPATLKILRRYSKSRAKFLFHRTRLDIAAMMGKEKSFLRYNYSSEMWRKDRKSKVNNTGALSKSAVDLYSVARPGDQLVLLDSAWLPQHVKAFNAAKKAGLKVHSLVYDLIPITMPTMVPQNAPWRFHDWLLHSTEYTDSYMAISKFARNDLVEFLKAYEVDRDVAVLALTQSRLPVLTEAQRSKPLSRKVREDIYPFMMSTLEVDEDVRNLAITPYVLCVGTIETRKNGWRLAAAWKHLLDQGHEDLPRLVFAGRKAAKNQAFNDLMAGTGNVYGWVSVVEGPSDEDLDYLYRNCQFAAMPSLAEGWGLPVGEALSYGKTAVVADCSSLPEVGGDMVEYCDPNSVLSIAEAVKKLTGEKRRTELEAKIAKTKLRTWSDVAEDLAAIVS